CIRRQGGKVLSRAVQVTHRVSHQGTLFEHRQAEGGLLALRQLVDQPQGTDEVPQGLTIGIPLGRVLSRTSQILHGAAVVPSRGEVPRQLCCAISSPCLIGSFQILPNALV